MLFSGQLASDAAQLHRGDTQIRCDVVLRDLLLHPGKLLPEYPVTFDGIEQNDLQFFFLFFQKIVLGYFTGQPLQIGVIVVVPGNKAEIGGPDDAIAQGLLRNEGRLAGQQGAVTADAGRRHEKLFVVFLALPVGKISPDNARFQEGDFGGHITLPDKMLMFGQRSFVKKRPDRFPGFLF